MALKNAWFSHNIDNLRVKGIGGDKKDISPVFVPVKPKVSSRKFILEAVKTSTFAGDYSGSSRAKSIIGYGDGTGP